MKTSPAGCRRRLLAVSAVALLVALAAASLPAGAGETVVGSGRIGCDEYLDSDETIKLSIENWVLGFFSFANLRSFNLDLLQNLDNGTLISALEGFCHTHPSARIADVSAELLKTLVASAEGDCRGEPAMATGELSLCHLPGTAGAGSKALHLAIPAVE